MKLGFAKTPLVFRITSTPETPPSTACNAEDYICTIKKKDERGRWRGRGGGEGRREERKEGVRRGRIDERGREGRGRIDEREDR